MTSSLEAVDKLIADQYSAFTVLSTKLLGVQDDIQYRAITGTGGLSDPQLTGETKIVVEKAQNLVTGLWIVVSLAGQRLDEVKAKRANVKTGFFGGGSAAKDLEDQLKLHNLTVHADKADKLPDELKQAIFTQAAGVTSVELLLSVGPTFLKNGAKAIIDIGDCMAALKAQIEDTESKLTQVTPTVAKIGGSSKLALSNATANLTKVRDTYEHDPLGVRKGFEQTVGQHITAINKALEGVQRAKEKAYADLADAKVLMQRLEDKQPTPARTPELRDWLTKLAARLDQEEWASASAGLDDWIKEASSVLAIKPPPSSYVPPAAKPSTPTQPVNHGQSGNTSHTGQTHQPPSGHYNQPPAPHVQQLPTSSDYQQYAPKEKSNLEKLLDGEMAASTTPAPSTVQKPVDPEMEKLVSAQTPPSGSQHSGTTPPSAALDTLVNGPGHQPSTAASGTAATTAPNNAALDALVNGHGNKTSAPQTGSGDAHGSNPALDTLVNGPGKGSTTTPPGTGDSKAPGGALDDLISGKTDKRPTNPPSPAKPTGNEVSSGSDPSKITELFDEKKKPQPQPTTVKAKEVQTPPLPPKDSAKPAATLSQAEKEAAERKALEDLLKG